MRTELRASDPPWLEKRQAVLYFERQPCQEQLGMKCLFLHAAADRLLCVRLARNGRVSRLVRTDMRLWLLFVAGAPLALAQPFTFGVKAGVPLTDFLDATHSGGFGYFATTNRYIVGPVAELRLPFGLGVEFDALYRHLNYTGVNNSVGVFTGGGPPGLLNSSTTSGAWEFPLLAKYRFPTKLVRPYVDAGVVWDTLSGLTQTTTSTFFPSQMTSTSSGSQALELNKKTVAGFVAGLGLDIHLLVLHVSPEVRYTRWGAQHFLFFNVPRSTLGIESNQSQFEFLVGFTFP